MKLFKFAIPILIFIASLTGLIYRKYFWCNVLLPKPGGPYGLGDIVEFIPLVLLGGVSLLGCLLGVSCLFFKKIRDVRYGVAILLLSAVAVPGYHFVHSRIAPVCNAKL